MDPNANLSETRELVAKAFNGETLDPHDTLRLAELVSSLDEWLTNGGFLPEAWAR